MAEKSGRASLGTIILTALLAALFAGLFGGLGALVINEIYFRPHQFQNETRVSLYRETYAKRIDSYEEILAMFSQAYWLERNLKAESSDKPNQERRLQIIEQIQRDLARLPAIGTEEVFDLGVNALNFYIENARKFTPEARKKMGRAIL